MVFEMERANRKTLTVEEKLDFIRDVVRHQFAYHPAMKVFLSSKLKDFIAKAERLDMESWQTIEVDGELYDVEVEEAIITSNRKRFEEVARRLLAEYKKRGDKELLAYATLDSFTYIAALVSIKKTEYDIY